MSSMGTPVRQATIFVEQAESEVIRIYDLDDQCMKASVASFEILSDLHASDYYSGGPQVVLHLRDFVETIRYVSQGGDELLGDHDKEIDALYCATTSVLRYLHAAHCVGKDAVTFQARRGSHEDRNISVSTIFTIALTQNAEYSALDYKKGIISRTYAYLDEKQLCMFLNDTTEETLKKLDSVLVKLFPRSEASDCATTEETALPGNLPG